MRLNETGDDQLRAYSTQIVPPQELFGLGQWGGAILAQREMMMPQMEEEEFEQAAMGPYYGMGQDITAPYEPITAAEYEAAVAMNPNYGMGPLYGMGQDPSQDVYRTKPGEIGPFPMPDEKSPSSTAGTRDDLGKAMIAMAAAVGVIVLGEFLYKKNKILDRFIHAAGGIAFGAASYFTFKTAVNNPSLPQVALAGVAGTVAGFYSLGSTVATFAPESWLKEKSAFTTVRKSIPVLSVAKA